MRLHTNLTHRDLYGITHGIDGVWPEFTEHGSRKRERAFEFHLVADQRKGRRRGNSGRYGAGDYAATWDEWGMVFARLFALDPEMDCYAYHGIEDFHWKTGQRFSAFGVLLHRGDDRWEFRNPADLFLTPHDQHRWNWDQAGSELETDDHERATIHVSWCKCGAIRRYVYERKAA
jgi:hypothetical protein